MARCSGECGTSYHVITPAARGYGMPLHGVVDSTTTERMEVQHALCFVGSQSAPECGNPPVMLPKSNILSHSGTPCAARKTRLQYRFIIGNIGSSAPAKAMDVTATEGCRVCCLFEDKVS